MSSHPKRRFALTAVLNGLGVLLGLSAAFGFWGDAKLYVPIFVGFLSGRWWATVYVFTLAFLDVAVRVFSGRVQLPLTEWDTVLLLGLLYACFAWLGVGLRKALDTMLSP